MLKKMVATEQVIRADRELASLSSSTCPYSRCVRGGSIPAFGVFSYMKFELQTLEEYSDAALLGEMVRVAQALNGRRLTIERFDSMARVHSTTIRNRFGSWQVALDKAGISEAVARRIKTFTRSEIVRALRDYAAENPGISVTRDTFAVHIGIDASTLNRRFGKWENLLSETGLPSLRRRYKDEECFENVLALWTHYGRQPHFAELNRPPSTVGSKAYVLRWGGWRAALSAFVKRVNDTERSDAHAAGETPQDPKPSDAPAITAPRSIGLALRYRVLSRDRFRCITCGASPAKEIGVELHVDHITPWSRGGLNVEQNLRTLCSRCNLGKGARIDDAEQIVGRERRGRVS